MKGVLRDERKNKCTSPPRKTYDRIKKQDFKHWNDAGREWREAILQGTVSNRYRNKKSGKILYEDFFPHGAILLRQSRHIRHDEV